MDIWKVNGEKKCENFPRFCIIKVKRIYDIKMVCPQIYLRVYWLLTEAKERKWPSDIQSEHWTRVQDRSKDSSQILPGDSHYCYAEQKERNLWGSRFTDFQFISINHWTSPNYMCKTLTDYQGETHLKKLHSDLLLSASGLSQCCFKSLCKIYWNATNYILIHLTFYNIVPLPFCFHF